MTSANLFHRCIKAGNGMPFILSCFDKCSVIAKLLPFFLGLPVITTIFLLIKFSSASIGSAFFVAYIGIISRMISNTSTHI